LQLIVDELLLLVDSHGNLLKIAGKYHAFSFISEQFTHRNELKIPDISSTPGIIDNYLTYFW
jgi:hypothetical protein